MSETASNDQKLELSAAEKRADRLKKLKDLHLRRVCYNLLATVFVVVDIWKH